MDIETFTPTDARKILKALGTGSAPAEYARHLLVGQTQWFETAIKQMSETALDQDFEVRFVRARYGGGKTHFLYCLEREAHDQGWVTSFILLKRDLVELDKFASLVREVARGLELPNGKIGLSDLLERAISVHASSYGIVAGKTVSLKVLDSARRKFRENLSHRFVAPPFSTVLDAAYASVLKGDTAQLQRIAEWLCGTDVSLIIEAGNTLNGDTLRIKPLGLSLAEEHLRIIGILCQLARFKGLFIGVDELEIIGRLPAQRKANSFQTLRALVDQNHSRRQPPSTCFFLAATPEMFEDPDKIPSYKALQDRIESLPSLTGRKSVNYRACVIDLDRTELGPDDLRSLAESLVRLHGLAFGNSPRIEPQLDDLVLHVVSGRYMMARPRLLCRCVIDLLNGQLGNDLAISVSARARMLQESREKELTGR